MTIANGTATIRKNIDALGKKQVTRTVPARITPKRVDTFTRVFDRETGRRVSAWHYGQSHVVLLGYQIDGEAYVEFPSRLEDFRG